MDEAGHTMDLIVKSVTHVADIMGEITGASQAQSDEIEQINRVIAQMDEITQQNAALVEQASAASASMYDHTNQVSLAMDKFNREEEEADAIAEKNRSALPLGWAHTT